MPEEVIEAGARNSKTDLAHIQTIHDSAATLGANCSLAESTIWKVGGELSKIILTELDGRSIPRGTVEPGPLKLVESWDWKEQALNLIEASDSPSLMKIKLIAPGKGSSAFYPAEVLKRDGPKVFTKGTHVYINHATAAEESVRPEGDWHKLAGALNGNAYWDESAKQGPGLYADALFTSDYAPLIKEKAPFTGMSIRASGVAEAKKTQDGVPVLKELTSAESVDVVTRAGAGGMILTEAARPGSSQEVEMTAEEITKLVEAAITKATSPLKERAVRGDAVVEANRVLGPISLHEAAKQLVVENVLRDIPLKDGELDTAKFKELVEAEAKRVGAVIGAAMGSGRVHSMGLVPNAELTEADRERQRNEAKRQRDEDQQLDLDEAAVFASITGIKKVKEAA